jgi:hypothetical protein
MTAEEGPSAVEALRQASVLRAEADALTNAYRRRTWWRFALVFIPVPLVLVLLRLEIEAWHYYLFGAAYLGLSGLLYSIDSRASDRCDVAERAAEAAERAARGMVTPAA